EERPNQKQGEFVPTDVIKGRTTSAQPAQSKTPVSIKKPKQIHSTVLPRDFKVSFGNDRLVDIRQELVRLKRDAYPNAGAVLLRVFLELSIQDYLQRTGELGKLIDKLKKKGTQVPFGTPSLKQMV